jgi:hypothetical protein
VNKLISTYRDFFSQFSEFENQAQFNSFVTLLKASWHWKMRYYRNFDGFISHLDYNEAEMLDALVFGLLEKYQDTKLDIFIANSDLFKDLPLTSNFLKSPTSQSVCVSLRDFGIAENSLIFYRKLRKWLSELEEFETLDKFTHFIFEYPIGTLTLLIEGLNERKAVPAKLEIIDFAIGELVSVMTVTKDFNETGLGIPLLLSILSKRYDSATDLLNYYQLSSKQIGYINRRMVECNLD